MSKIEYYEICKTRRYFFLQNNTNFDSPDLNTRGIIVCTDEQILESDWSNHIYDENKQTNKQQIQN